MLKPGGVLILSFSEDYFAEKAIAGWLARDTPGQVALVRQYLKHTGYIRVEAVLGRGPSTFVAVIGRRPLDSQIPGAQGALLEMDVLLGNPATSEAVLERWEVAYRQAVRDAEALGIPSSAMPKLPANPSVSEIRQARDYLGAMVASFLSSGL